jgi:hypothetical protein
VTRKRQDGGTPAQGGDYFAIGVGGAVTGKGADVLIIDDPHSEQEAAMAASNPDVYDKVIRVVHLRTTAASYSRWGDRHCG